MKITIGIFFGGPSRERERFFLSGRTVYENLDRATYEAIPIFVDSQFTFIQLDWEHLYRPSIRDFYPALEHLPPSPHAFRVYEESLEESPYEQAEEWRKAIGRSLSLQELPQLINLAFLAMPGGGDTLPRMLSDLRIPFTGWGVEAAGRLHDRGRQKERLAEAGLFPGRFLRISRQEWLQSDRKAMLQEVAGSLGFPVMVRPAHQPAPIGLSVVDGEAGEEAFSESIDSAFFRETIALGQWRHQSDYDKIDHLRLLTDPRDGLGFPMDVTIAGQSGRVYHPEQLLELLNQRSVALTQPDAAAVLESTYSETEVLVEPLLQGTAFSCLVLRQENGRAVALLPTERRYGEELFDTGDEDADGLPDDMKILDLPADQLDRIRSAAAKGFEAVGAQAVARVDGFLLPDGQIVIDELHTGLSLSATAFLFQQMATIGLTPAQSLNYLIRVSLQERLAEQPEDAVFRTLLNLLDEQLAETRAGTFRRQKVAVLMGGDPLEAALSLESGRQVYQKLLGSEHNDPLAIWVVPEPGDYQLYQLPISLVLMNDAGHLRQRLFHHATTDLEEDVREACRAITLKYGSRDLIVDPQRFERGDLREWVDSAFICLIGHPANGRLQADLEAMQLPHTGSRAAALRLAGDRHLALEELRRHGFAVPPQVRLTRAEFEADPEQFMTQVEEQLSYPFIAKPLDVRCHPAVSRLNNRAELQAYARLLFRPEGHEGLESRYVLRLRPREPFPRREAVLFQGLVNPKGARQFMEIKGALITLPTAEGLSYRMFPPSEVLNNRDFLTLQEQYLSGGGRYLTPPRFAGGKAAVEATAGQITRVLERAARILHLEGSARLDGIVRILEGGQVETTLFDVHPLTAFTAQGCFFQQAIRAGLEPRQLVETIIEATRQPAPAVTPEERESVLESAPEPVWVPSSPAPPVREESSVESRIPYGMSAGDGFQLRRPTLGERLREWGKNTWEFLKSPIFLKNLGAAAAFLLLFFIIFNGVLRWYTHHGESLEVEDYRNMTLDEARRKARSRSFKIVISDSVFLVDRPANIVLEQDPHPFSRVKENRRIYLTITSSQAPDVLLPKLEGAYNYPTYERKLKRLGIKAVVRERRFDSRQEENTILYFYYGNQQITESDLRRGVKVPKGSTLEFVVTERLTDQVPAPNLICMRYGEASFLISASGLVVGEVIGDFPDQDNAYVYLQEPDPGIMLRKGDQITVYLTRTRPADCSQREETPQDTTSLPEQGERE